MIIFILYGYFLSETPAYDFAVDSYVKYQLSETDAQLGNREANYKVTFRTREKYGLLWMITNLNGLEFTSLEVSPFSNLLITLLPQ